MHFLHMCVYLLGIEDQNTHFTSNMGTFLVKVEVRIGFMLGLAGMVGSRVMYYSCERNTRKYGGGVMTWDNIVSGVITRGITVGSSRKFRFMKLVFLFKFFGLQIIKTFRSVALVLWYSESCGRATRTKNTVKRQGQHVIATSASLHS